MATVWFCTLDKIFDRLLEGLRRLLRVEPFHGLASAIDKELLEVPQHIVAGEAAGLRGLQEAVQGRLALAVHVNLVHEREQVRALAFGKLLDLRVAARLLTTKLVAREGQDDKTTGSVLFVQFA